MAKVDNTKRSKFVIGNKDDFSAIEYERLTTCPKRKIYLRIGRNDHIDLFKEIIKTEFGIDVDLMKVKIDLPKEIGCDWREMPKWGYSEDIWPCYYIWCLKDEDRDKLGRVLDINITPKCKSYWFPERPKLGSHHRYWGSTDDNVGAREYDPKYPIYIISYGRAKNQVTRKFIHNMDIDYHMVVETDQIEDYVNEGCPRENILEFSPKDKKKWTEGKKNRFDCKNTKDGGSIPVRNFIWQHSVKNGASKHWCIDDNIDGFYIFNKNERLECKTGQVFRCIEDYADRYENLLMCGMNYLSFMPEISKNRQLIQRNTRIYSVILLDNKIPELFKDKQNPQGYMWRGSYNEDTDLSLRLLKKGLPTCLFNMFLANKMTTKSCKGGNTDSIYKGDGLQKKLDSLIAQHPDVTKQTSKYKKDNHHQVDYTGFVNNELIYKAGVSENLMCSPHDYDLEIFTDETIPERVSKQKKYIPPTQLELEVIEPSGTEIEIDVDENYVIPSKLHQAEIMIRNLDMDAEDLTALMILILKGKCGGTT